MNFSIFACYGGGEAECPIMSEIADTRTFSLTHMDRKNIRSNPIGYAEI